MTPREGVSKRTCPIHGPQGDESVSIRLTPKVEHYCLVCFADWVRANLQPLTDLSDTHIATPATAKCSCGDPADKSVVHMRTAPYYPPDGGAS